MRILRGAASALAGIIVLATPASAAKSPEWQACEGSAPQYSIAQQLAGCTAVIESGRENPKNLSIAYDDRGYTYYSNKQYDLALADYDRAIAIDANNAYAYSNRAGTYYDMQQYDRALADFERAISIQPGDLTAIYNPYAGRAMVHARLGKCTLAKTEAEEAYRLSAAFDAQKVVADICSGK